MGTAADQMFDEYVERREAEEAAERAAWLETPEGQKVTLEHERISVNLERVRLAAERAAVERERAWSQDHSKEWVAWLAVRKLLPVEFGGGPDFSDFLRVVGKCRVRNGVLRRRNPREPYTLDNLRWAARKPKSSAEKSPRLTYKEAVKEFGISKTRLYELREAQQVEYVKVPGVGYRFTRASLERLVEDHTTPANPTAKAPANPARRPAARKAPRPANQRFKFL